MVISYRYKGNLYLNITNHCTNKCTFCMRNFSYVFVGYDLKLEREPTREEIIENVFKNYSGEKEIVFCGIGEPLIRLNDVLAVAKELKEHSQVPIRVDTNGQAKLLYPYRDVVKELFKVIDAISVSLNAENERKYNRLCRPQFSDAYKKMIEFAKECTKYFHTSLSVVNLSIIDIEKCRKIATDIGAQFLVRKFRDTSLEKKRIKTTVETP